jgi:aspartyl-tRNA(Asn)/glutamyl-tRNA(Gln) amidotransferase subunit A
LITLKEALTLASDDIKKLRDDLTSKIKESNIGAYVEQLTSTNISIFGSGDRSVPLNEYDGNGL